MMEENKVDEQLGALRQLRSAGQLSEPDYGKMVVMLAWTVAQTADIEEAIELVRSLPLEYFASHQLQQMADDGAYAETVRLLADAVEEFNETQVLPNMGAAEA